MVGCMAFAVSVQDDLVGRVPGNLGHRREFRFAGLFRDPQLWALALLSIGVTSRNSYEIQRNSEQLQDKVDLVVLGDSTSEPSKIWHLIYIYIYISLEL